MIHRDPRCVFVANSMAVAVVTATWLTENGIPAQVMDLMTLGGLEGLTGWAPGISARGLEVWVEDAAHASEARRLLAEHQASIAQRATDAEHRGPVEVGLEIFLGRRVIRVGRQRFLLQLGRYPAARVADQNHSPDSVRVLSSD